MKKLIILVTGFQLFFISALVAAENEDRTSKKSGSAFSTEGYVKLEGGEVVNYNSYDITSPYARLIARLKGSYDLSEDVYTYISYKFLMDRYFSDVKNSSATLNQYGHDIKFRIAKDPQKYHLGFNFSFTNYSRPKWPDLYQPNPINYAAGVTQNNIVLGVTDRFGYTQYEPELTFAYLLSKDTSFFSSLLYSDKTSVQDPSFTAAKPTHVVPSSYTKSELQLGLKHKLSNMDLRWNNTISKLTSKVELARDAIVGKTNYTTLPNPLYSENNIISDVSLDYSVIKDVMVVTPEYSFEYNSDVYQGYESYMQNSFALAFEHELVKDKFSYKLQSSASFRNYGPNSYGVGKTTTHLPTKDGKRLYKNYFKASIGTSYKVLKNLEVYLDGTLDMKKTNYPDYVMGVNPVNKNYNIKFNYNNYSISSGTVYKF